MPENSRRKLQMMKRTATGLAMTLVVLSALCTTSLAQTQSAATAGAQKTPERLPGLDKRFIDTTADPCQDFFKYACGNFPKLYPIPYDRSAYGTGAILFEYNEAVLASTTRDANSMPTETWKTGGPPRMEKSLTRKRIAK
jgi:hypothetical protein